MGYADGKYGVITRKWFGLTLKNGGETAAAITVGTGDAGPDTAKVSRFYPKGPCKIIKFGALCVATGGHGASTVDRCLARLVGRGASASNMASFNLCAASSTISLYSIGSIESSNATDFPITQVKAGEYVSIVIATKETDKGTDLGSTLTGSFAFFVDIVPTHDNTRWNAESIKYQG